MTIQNLGDGVTMQMVSISTVGVGLIIMEAEMENNQKALARLLAERRLLDERIIELQKRQNTLSASVRSTVRIKTGINAIDAYCN